MSQGGLDKSPFPDDDIEKITANIRKVLTNHGYDDGKARPGDADQLTEVRLAQSLLGAMRDPDHYFCEW